MLQLLIEQYNGWAVYYCDLSILASYETMKTFLRMEVHRLVPITKMVPEVIL